MSKQEKDRPVATVNEEPTSSATTNRQINQAGQEATRNTNNSGPAAPQEKPRDQNHQGCGCE
jgi:hypothetical protein